MTLDAPIIAAVVGVAGSGALIAIADRIRVGIRLTVLEALFKEKSAKVSSLDEKSDEHANRITAVEGIIMELRRLADSMKDVPVLLSTVKAMMDSDRERIRDVESLIKTTLQGVQGMQGVQGVQGRQGIPGESGNR